MSKKIGTSHAPKRSTLNTMALSVLRCGVRAGLSTAVRLCTRFPTGQSRCTGMSGLGTSFVLAWGVDRRCQELGKLKMCVGGSWRVDGSGLASA